MNDHFDIRVIDSHEHAAARRRELDIDRGTARRLGEEAVRYVEQGWYPGPDGRPVAWSDAVELARDGTVSIPPDAQLPERSRSSPGRTLIEVANETALAAARRLVDARLVEAGRLVDADQRPLVLNMANGVRPGGGFLTGARAQEESLCRSSALYATLVGDPMYAAHATRPQPDSTDWAILSPDVPVFRDDLGRNLDRPWPASFITSAAPHAPTVGEPAAGDLLERRVGRLLDIAHAHGFTTLVLGAWGCGAFGNDPVRTAQSFHHHLQRGAGAFEHIVFAITDWSPERRLLGAFAATFDATHSGS